VPSFTRHSYSNLESVHSARGKFSICNINSIVCLIEAPVSKPWAIPYSSNTCMLRVMRLHFIDDQCKMFALLCLSVSTITYPICDEWSGLFAKEESVNTSSHSKSGARFRGTNRSPLVALSVCQSRRLFSFSISPFWGFVTCATADKSNAASGCDTVATYAPLARSATYWSFVVTLFRLMPLELVRSVVSGETWLIL
jgi:hypothetical protein